MKTVIIGAGNMGRTYARAFIDKKILSRDNLNFLVKTNQKSKRLEAPSFSYGELNKLKEFDLVIFAIKPQNSLFLMAELSPYFKKSAIILSVMAGVSMSRLKSTLNINKIVRAMPNLPAQLGAGFTVYTASEELSREELYKVQNLLQATGKTLYVKEEDKIDSATAVSGSGPAFVFYLLESMIQSAKFMGFKDYEAEAMVKETFEGALELLNSNTQSCSTWIKKISSEGGTTEAAIKHFSEKGFKKIIKGGLAKAETRAKELGG